MERDAGRRRVREFFDGLTFESVDLTAFIGRRASELSHEFELKGPDACHLVMAEFAECDRFYALDDGLLKVGNLGQMEICLPRTPYGGPGSLFGAGEIP